MTNIIRPVFLRYLTPRLIFPLDVIKGEYHFQLGLMCYQQSFFFLSFLHQDELILVERIKI